MDNRYMTFAEKLKELHASKIMDYEGIASRVVYGRVYEDFDRNRVVCRRDLRAELDAAIKASGMPQRQVAIAMGLQPQQLNAYLHGRQACGYERMEEMLFLLDGKMLKREDEV